VYVPQYPETVASLMGIRTAFAPSFDTNCVMTLVPVAEAEAYVSDEESPET
jgi:hypothetical protein